MRCLERSRVSDTLTCGFAPVADDGSCPNGGVPFNNRCVPAPTTGEDPASSAPCGGQCDAGEVCNIDGNICELPPNTLGEQSGCLQTCDSLSILVYENPDAMLYNQCCAVTCACEPLPQLDEGSWGPYSDTEFLDDRLAVSAYNPTYGDLNYVLIDQATLEVQSLEFVDGVPNATPIAPSEGPRGGIAEAGPDVGRYSSLALARSGAARIAYYDADAGALKFAAKVDAAWQISVVDDDGGDDSGDADIGQFASLALDDADIPHVTYYADRVTLGGQVFTGPMYARAKIALPQGPQDWEFSPVELIEGCSKCAPLHKCVMGAAGPTCMPEVQPLDCNGGNGCGCVDSCVDVGGSTAGCRENLPDDLRIPCAGACDDNQTCVADAATTGTICAAESGGCAISCAGDDICVDPGTGPECRLATPFSNIAGLPDGSGLFTSLVLHNDKPTLVYYDHARQHLRGAVANFTVGQAIGGGFSAVALVCDPSSDFGHSATLSIDPDGNFAAAFQGDSGKTLWVYRGSDFCTVGSDGCTASAEMIDNGIRPGSIHWVGMHPSIAFADDSSPLIVYGDQTDLDLLLVRQTPSGWKRQTIAHNGGQGSFANVLVKSRKAFVSSYLRQRDAAQRDASELIWHTLDLDTDLLP